MAIVELNSKISTDISMMERNKLVHALINNNNLFHIIFKNLIKIVVFLYVCRNEHIICQTWCAIKLYEGIFRILSLRGVRLLTIDECGGFNAILVV